MGKITKVHSGLILNYRKFLVGITLALTACSGLLYSQVAVAGACSAQSMMLKDLKLEDYAKVVGSLTAELDHMILISGESEEQTGIGYLPGAIDFRSRGVNFKVASLDKNEVGVDLSRNYNTVAQLVRIYDEDLCEQKVLIIAERDGIIYGFDTLDDLQEGDYEEILGYREGEAFTPDSGFKVSAFVLRYRIPTNDVEETKVLDEMEVFFIKRQMRSS